MRVPDFETLNVEAMVEVSAALGQNQNAIRMVALHTRKPWIPGFLGTLISPLRPGLKKFFKTKILKTGTVDWYYPSKVWWVAHAKASHPPDGAGCSTSVHSDFLTRDGKYAEFLYAAMTKSGIHVLEREDFEVECEFWKRYF